MKGQPQRRAIEVIELRARIMRACVRLLVKPRLRAVTTVEAARQHLNLLGRFVDRPPRGTETIVVDAGGVKADSIATATSRHDRHILHLHGGSYLAGWPGLYRDLTWRLAKLCRARVLCTPSRQRSTTPWPPTAGCSRKEPLHITQR
jgi:hypothetical protein